MSDVPEIESLKNKFEQERSKLLALVRTLAPTDLFLAQDGNWSVKDILAHIANAERVNVRFARQMLEQEHPVQITSAADDFPDFEGPFELDRYNAYIHTKVRDHSWNEVMDALDKAHGETLAWIETLRAEDLERGGLHAAWGEQTVRSMLKILILHDKMHALEIGRRIKASEPL
jgi:hypothetical protein